MKILIVGSGGREHALAWKAAQSPKVIKVFVAPGNAGTALEPHIDNVAIAVDDIDALLAFAQTESIDLTIIGPEVPLVLGIVDRFQKLGLQCFGPSAKAAQLEGSKTFCKDFMARHHIPTADYQSFTDKAQSHCLYQGKRRAHRSQGRWPGSRQRRDRRPNRTGSRCPPLKTCFPAMSSAKQAAAW